MLNEGLLHSDAKTATKSEMIRQLQKLGRTTPEAWERAVFESVTGMDPDDIDWSVEDNQAGYYTWIKSFDQLIEELVDDGFVRSVAKDESGERELEPVEPEQTGDWSQFVYPSRAPS